MVEPAHVSVGAREGSRPAKERTLLFVLDTKLLAVISRGHIHNRARHFIHPHDVFSEAGGIVVVDFLHRLVYEFLRCSGGVSLGLINGQEAGGGQEEQEEVEEEHPLAGPDAVLLVLLLGELYLRLSEMREAVTMKLLANLTLGLMSNVKRRLFVLQNPYFSLVLILSVLMKILKNFNILLIYILCSKLSKCFISIAPLSNIC